MAESSCGASVFAAAIRVAVLDPTGVPNPGPRNVYTTDALTQLDGTPVYYKGQDIQQPNANGEPCVIYKARDSLIRYDFALTICTLDAELENMLAGGQTFLSGSETIGGSVPAVGSVGAPYGVSIELWSKYIVDGDQDGTWPWIHWVIPRSYWQPDKVSWANGPMPRAFTGYSSQNPNWFNGPANDWNFSSDRSLAWAKTTGLPAVTCGAQTLAAS